MKLFDDIVDTVGDIAEGVGDFIGDNLGDLFDIGGDVIDYYAGEQQQENLEKIAKKQRDEMLRTAKYNAALQREDADLYRKQAIKIRQAADLEYYNNTRTAERIMAAQTARYGKAGVAPSEGTPLNVAVQTTAEAQRDGLMILNAGRDAMSRALDTSRKLDLSAEETLRAANVQADILDDAMKDQLTAIEYQQWTTGAKSLFDFGIRHDWWE